MTVIVNYFYGLENSSCTREIFTLGIFGQSYHSYSRTCAVFSTSTISFRTVRIVGRAIVWALSNACLVFRTFCRPEFIELLPTRSLVALGISLVVAEVSWRLIEQTFIRIKNKRFSRGTHKAE